MRKYQTTSLPEYEVMVARILAVSKPSGGAPPPPASYAYGGNPEYVSPFKLNNQHQS